MPVNDGNAYQQFSVVDHGIADTVKAMMQQQPDEEVHNGEVWNLGFEVGMTTVAEQEADPLTKGYLPS